MRVFTKNIFCHRPEPTVGLDGSGTLQPESMFVLVEMFSYENKLGGTAKDLSSLYWDVGSFFNVSKCLWHLETFIGQLC